VLVLRKAATKAATSVEIIKNVSDSIIVINQKGIVQSFNPAAENLFGYPAVEVVGRNVTMLMPDPYRTAHDEHLQRYLHTGKAASIMGPATPFCIWMTQKHLTVERTMGLRT
jgi:PAS domain-containing protein